MGRNIYGQNIADFIKSVDISNFKTEYRDDVIRDGRSSLIEFLARFNLTPGDTTGSNDCRNDENRGSFLCTEDIKFIHKEGRRMKEWLPVDVKLPNTEPIQG